MHCLDMGWFTDLDYYFPLTFTLCVNVGLSADRGRSWRAQDLFKIEL